MTSLPYLHFPEFPYLFKTYHLTKTAIELKTLIIRRISEINDVSFLKASKTILDYKTETGVVQLTPKQLDDIIESKKDIAQGLFIDNSVLDKEVRQWLNVR